MYAVLGSDVIVSQTRPSNVKYMFVILLGHVKNVNVLL